MRKIKQRKREAIYNAWLAMMEIICIKYEGFRDSGLGAKWILIDRLEIGR